MFPWSERNHRDSPKWQPEQKNHRPHQYESTDRPDQENQRRDWSGKEPSGSQDSWWLGLFSRLNSNTKKSAISRMRLGVRWRRDSSIEERNPQDQEREQDCDHCCPWIGPADRLMPALLLRMLVNFSSYRHPSRKVHMLGWPKAGGEYHGATVISIFPQYPWSFRDGACSALRRRIQPWASFPLFRGLDLLRQNQRRAREY